MSGAEPKTLPAFSLSGGQQLTFVERAGRRIFKIVEPDASRKPSGYELEFPPGECAAFEAGEITAHQLAEVYGVSLTTVRDAMRRQQVRQKRERSA